MSAWEREVAAAKYCIPGIKIWPLEESWWRWMLKIGTSGFTFGRRVYIARREWGTPWGAATLAEEVEHAAQYASGGIAWFLFLYLIFPLPVLISARALLEYQGARANLCARVRHGLAVGPADIHAAAMRFVGWRYGFMAPWAFWWVRSRLTKAVAQCRR